MLEYIFSAEDLKNFICSKYTDLGNYHFGLGMLIRNNILKEDSKLYNIFIKAGILAKDDMSEIIIECFYLYEKTKQTTPLGIMPSGLFYFVGHDLCVVPKQIGT